MTIADALAEGRVYLSSASPSAALDAELLLAAVLKRPRERVLAHADTTLTERATRRFRELLEQRYAGVPLPMLTGTTAFFGRTFSVTRSVMVPRPETEALAAEAVRALRALSSRARPVAVDVGTGAGVIAVTIAAEVPRSRVIALDKSRAALAVARRNATRHRVLSRVTFLESDLLNRVPRDAAPRLIAANLPYVPSDDLTRARERPETAGLTFEPQGALDGGPDGLFVIRRFFAHLARFPHTTRDLRFLLLEHSPDQRRAVQEAAHEVLPAFSARAITPYVTAWQR